MPQTFAEEMAYPNITFEEWVEHWGNERLNERMSKSCANHKRRWEQRNQRSHLFSFPAWELCLGGFWNESLEDWQARWSDSGGQFYEKRMIAPKWSKIWSVLSTCVPDSIELPYPPFSKRSCVTWRDIDRDESILLGVITESDLESNLPGEPSPLIGKDGKPIPRDVIERLLKDRPPREEQVAIRKAKFEAEIAAAREAYERRNS